VPELRPDSARFCPLCGDRLAPEPVGPEGREHPVCTGCRFVFYLPPKVVACTLPIREGRILLTRRAIDPARGLWTFPGGFVDWGEDVREGALRETREEVGLAVRLQELLGVYSYVGAPFVIVVFIAEAPDGAEPVPCATEVLELAYFGPEEIPWDALAFPSTRDALRDWLDRVGAGV
jgi:ADP-ribose pyrophosphatase YjhB (NUDIX family)